MAFKPVVSEQFVPTAPEQQVELAVLLRAIWRRRYLILSITVVCTAAAVTLALLSTPVYRAQVVVTETRDPNSAGGASGTLGKISGLASMAGIDIGGAGNADTVNARAILTSRHLVEEFIQRNQDVIPALYPRPKSKPTLWMAVERFRQSVLAIYEDKVKGTTTIVVDWTDPGVAARWATSFVALANELVRTRAMNEATRSIAYLNDQIAKTNVLEMRAVMYQLIESETKTLMLVNGRAEYAFTTVDPAVAPELRIRPKRAIISAIGLVCGLLIGVVIAYAYDTFDRSRAPRPRV